MRNFGNVDRRFIPVLERLEGRKLLADMGSFPGPIILSASYNKHAYVITWMNFTVQVKPPAEFPGATFSSVQYILSNGVGLQPGDVKYDTTTGKETDGAVTVLHNFASPPAQDQALFTAYKDAGDYKVDILAQLNVIVAGKPGKVTRSDELTVTVETPTVTNLFVDEQSNQFTWVDPNTFQPQSGPGPNDENFIGFTPIHATTGQNGQTVYTPGVQFHATVVLL